ncbi:hypothetical protein OSB04_004200, partial [Centaurea solstitialis]
MPRQISPVTTIQQHGKRWTTLVHILECHHIQHTQDQSEFKRIILTDPDGTKLTALIFSSHLRYYMHTFQQYKRYYISNAVVIRNQAKYAMGPYQFSWVLNNRTLVEELSDPIPLTLPCKFNFTPFKKLHKYAESDIYQDVRGMVVQCLPTYDQGPDLPTRRDIIIVNEEKVLLPITLWNEFSDYEGSMLQSMIASTPLIFGLRLKVTTFNGLSLTTKASSRLLVNPPVSEELQMQHWYNSHKTEVQELLERKDFKNNNLLLPYPSDEDITPITKVVDSFGMSSSSWVTGKLSLPMQDHGFFYTGCANCHKALEADTTWIVTCPSCKTESEIIAMSRMLVTIKDATGSIQATMYTPDVEKFIPFTATQLKESEENGQSVNDAIATTIQSSFITAFLRAYTTEYRGTSQTRVNIIKAYTPKEKPPPHTKSPPRYGMSHAMTSESTSEENQASPTEPIPITAEKVIIPDMKEAKPMKKP